MTDPAANAFAALGLVERGIGRVRRRGGRVRRRRRRRSPVRLRRPARPRMGAVHLRARTPPAARDRRGGRERRRQLRPPLHPRRVDLDDDVEDSAIEILAGRVGAEMGMSAEELKDLATAAKFRDLGMATVPDEIITKLGPLTDEEWAVVRSHPQRSAEMLGAGAAFDVARAIIRANHEHLDGSGYPNGLAGAEIPTGARILLVVESYVAMTEDRPYRNRLEPDAAIEQLEQRSGSVYDAEAVAALARVLRGRSARARPDPGGILGCRDGTRVRARVEPGLGYGRLPRRRLHPPPDAGLRHGRLADRRPARRCSLPSSSSAASRGPGGRDRARGRRVRRGRPLGLLPCARHGHDQHRLARQRVRRARSGGAGSGDGRAARRARAGRLGGRAGRRGARLGARDPRRAPGGAQLDRRSRSSPRSGSAASCGSWAGRRTAGTRSPRSSAHGSDRSTLLGLGVAVTRSSIAIPRRRSRPSRSSASSTRRPTASSRSQSSTATSPSSPCSARSTRSRRSSWRHVFLGERITRPQLVRASRWPWPASAWWRRVGEPTARSARGSDGEGRDRTSDTAIFSRVLYQLSYLAAGRESIRADKGTASGTVLPLLGGRSTTPDSSTPRPPGQAIASVPARRELHADLVAGLGGGQLGRAAPVHGDREEPRRVRVQHQLAGVHVGERLGAAHVVAVVGGDDLGQPARLEEAVELRARRRRAGCCRTGRRAAPTARRRVPSSVWSMPTRRTRSAGSSAGPSVGSGSPAARRPAAGEKTSRAWNVRETGWSITSGFAISWASHDPAARLGRRDQKAVVGPDEQAAVARAKRDRPGAPTRRPGRPPPGGRRPAGTGRAGEDACAVPDRLGPDPVRDVHDLGLRAGPQDDAVADADEVVRRCRSRRGT